MSNFTRGPWVKNEYGELKEPGGKDVGVWGLGISHVMRSPEAEANARLIESAPCLLAALQAITNSGPDAIPIKEAFEMAHRAIERATGVKV
jgi:hypothetical protein